MRVKKDCTKGLVSDFVFIRKTQVHLEWSSTIVRKYLCPSTVGVYRGSQKSQCIKAKTVE
jgi:hypothetical protein